MRWLWLMLLAGCVASGSDPDPEPDDDMDLPDAQVEIDLEEDLPPPIEYGQPCDPFLQDCVHGKCVPNLDGASKCMAELTNRLPGEACETITQCMRGAYCADLGGMGPRCWMMCDFDGIEGGASDTCTSGTACQARVTSIPEIGLCAGSATSCDIYTQDCPRGDCVVAANATSGEFGTYCGIAGDRVGGENCENHPGSCVRGAICVRRADAQVSTCEAVCNPASPQCPSAKSCSGVALSSGVNFCQ